MTVETDYIKALQRGKTQVIYKKPNAMVTFWIMFWVMSVAMLAVPGCMGEAYPAEPVKIDMAKIAMIESSGNPLAHNKRDDSRGLYQITPICLKEYNNFHPGAEYTMNDLWNVSSNSKIADWYINKRIPQMIKYYGKPDTVENRIVAFNAGIRYVKTGEPIPEITKRYLEKYFR